MMVVFIIDLHSRDSVYWILKSRIHDQKQYSLDICLLFCIPELYSRTSAEYNRVYFQNIQRDIL